ncbi:MAG: hypothetical protein JJW00_02675 [Sulfurimonas sp.]|nr:hypothetical protein [Sulfurimonas sp.]
MSQKKETTLQSATLEDLKRSDFVISVGNSLKNDNMPLKLALYYALTNNKSYISSIYPIEEKDSSNLLSLFIKNEVGSEEAALAMIANIFVDDKSDQEEFFDALDIGYLSAESNISEEELDIIKTNYIGKQKPVLVVGEDTLNHPRAKNIVKIARYIEENTPFKVLMIPMDRRKFSYKTDEKIDAVEELGEFNGSVVYSVSALEKEELIGSAQFALCSKIRSGDNVKFSIDGVEYIRHFKIDKYMKGTIAYNQIFCMDVKSSAYRYNQVKIEVINE